MPPYTRGSVSPSRGSGRKPGASSFIQKHLYVSVGLYVSLCVSFVSDGYCPPSAAAPPRAQLAKHRAWQAEMTEKIRLKRAAVVAGLSQLTRVFSLHRSAEIDCSAQSHGCE